MRGIGLEPMHQAIVEVEDNSPIEVEPTHESIDLPITTSENIVAGSGVGEGLRKQRPQMMAMEDLEVDAPVVLEEQKESSTTTASQRQQQPEPRTAFGAAGQPVAGGRDANGREELLVDSEDLPNDEEEEEEDDDDYEEDQA